MFISLYKSIFSLLFPIMCIARLLLLNRFKSFRISLQAVPHSTTMTWRGKRGSSVSLKSASVSYWRTRRTRNTVWTHCLFICWASVLDISITCAECFVWKSFHSLQSRLKIIEGIQFGYPVISIYVLEQLDFIAITYSIHDKWKSHAP